MRNVLSKIVPQEKYGIFERIVIMIMHRYFQIVLASILVALWLISFKLWILPQEALADDMDIKNRLSYISKIVGVMESSMIKMEGDLRFVKRQADVSTTNRDASEQRLVTLEAKITAIKGLVDSIEMDLAEMDGNIAYIESDIDSIASGSCDNIFLCRQKKY